VLIRNNTRREETIEVIKNLMIQPGKGCTMVSFRKKENQKKYLIPRLRDILGIIANKAIHEMDLHPKLPMERLKKIASSNNQFEFMALVSSLLFILTESQEGLKLIPQSVGRNAHLLIICEYCSIDEAIELSVLLNEFIGIEVANTYHYKSKVYAKASSRLLVEVEPIYQEEDH